MSADRIHDILVKLASVSSREMSSLNNSRFDNYVSTDVTYIDERMRVSLAVYYWDPTSYLVTLWK